MAFLLAPLLLQIWIWCPTCTVATPVATPVASAVATGTPAATATATATSTPVASATPSAVPTSVANCPAAPTLTNRQTFQPGASFGGHSVAGNGTTDDSAAMASALAAGDVFIVGGHTYLIGSTGTVNVPAGRNIQCQDHTAVLKFSPTGSSLQAQFTVAGSNNIFNCRFTGPYSGMHNQVPAPGWDGCNGTCPSGGKTASSPPYNANDFIVGWTAANVNVVGNDFDGIAGFNGGVELGTTNATCPHNWVVCANSFESSGLTGLEISCGYNNLINYNTFTNASADEEAWPNNQTQLNSQIQHNTFDHNTLHWYYGTAVNNNGWCGIEANRLMADSLHVCPGCTTSGATSMSTNVISNNTVDSPNGTVGGVAGCTNIPCGKPCGILSQSTLGRATLSNNAISGACGICNQ